MIDPSKLQNSQESEDFNDTPLHNDAFQLESLPTYPGELPYSDAQNADGNAPSSAPEDKSDDGSKTKAETLAPAEASELRATLEAELARSKEKKSKKDNLEDSINRLKASLQSDPTDPASGPIAAANSDLSTNAAQNSTESVSEGSSHSGNAADRQALVDDFEELPVEIPHTQSVQHNFDEALVDSMPSTSDTILADESVHHQTSDITPEFGDIATTDLSDDVAASANNSDILQSDELAVDDIPKRRRFRLIYGLAAGLAIIALAASGVWWKLHSGIPSGTTQIAQNTQQMPTVVSQPSNGTVSSTPSVAESVPQTTVAASSAPAASTPVQQTASAINQDRDGSSHSTNSTQPTALSSNKNDTKPAEVSSAKPDIKTDKSHNSLAANSALENKRTDQATSVKPADTHADKAKVVPDEKKKSSAALATPSTATTKASSTEGDAARIKNQNLTTTQKATAEKEKKALLAKSTSEQPTDKVVKPKLPTGEESKKIAAEAKAAKDQKAKEAKEAKDAKIAKDAKLLADKRQAEAATKLEKEKLATAKQTEAITPAIPEPRLVAKPVIKPQANARGLYTVQVYSSPSKDDAEDWMKRLRKKNIEGSSLTIQQVRGTTYYRVRFGTFATKEEAEGAAINSGFASSWVDRVK